jgi:hypothetical protein
MNIGLVGWGCASGNGGMNSDIASLASWVTHWLVPEHPKLKNHQPYLDKCSSKEIIICKLDNDIKKYEYFLNSIDALLYVEHPCIKTSYKIVEEAKKLNKTVIGIPMWEWWPERAIWALQTDILLSVTSFTSRYLNSLSDVLHAGGYSHSWRHKVIGGYWGVNLDDFPFTQKVAAKKFVYINGNGGYKNRKAADVIFNAFSLPNSPELLVYSQKESILEIPKSENIIITHKNFPCRSDVYESGDVFIFTSFWEGLCHGLYEAQAMGGVVITTDHPPMNECGTPFLIPIEKTEQEELAGKKIVKAIPSYVAINALCAYLSNENIAEISLQGRRLIDDKYNLKENLKKMYKCIVENI